MSFAAPEVRARAFDAWADEYESFRPGYPSALFDLIGDRFELGPIPRAVDLGAGTGKVARAVAARGWHVTAVEPGSRMLGVLDRAAAAEGVAVDAIQATAEDTGLDAGSFDVALAGEAWHWFDPPRVLAEVARIVRPAGGLAFFWNVVDERASDLVAGERELVARYGIDGSDVRKPGPRPETREALRAAPGFEEPEFIQVPHRIRMSGAGYVGLARTKSHLRTAPTQLQERFVPEFKAMLEAHGIGLHDELEVPYVVDCWLTRRSSR